MAEHMETVKLILRIVGACFIVPGIILMLMSGFNSFLFGSAMVIVGLYLAVIIPHTHPRDEPRSD